MQLIQYLDDAARRAVAAGDVLGTSTLSFTDGFRTTEGGLFEIAAAPFGRPLRNALAVTAAAAVTHRVLR